MDEEIKKYSEEVAESQAEVFYGGLVDTNMLDRVELVSGMRGLARGEEHRRVVATSTSRRGNRFNHFFAHNEVFIGQKCLNRLCNALVVEWTGDELNGDEVMIEVREMDDAIVKLGGIG